MSRPAPVVQWDDDAEQAVICAMLNDEEAIRQARTVVGADAFYRTAHRHIFAAAIALQDAGTRTDPLTVASWLEDRQLLEAIGGKDYLGFLIDVVSTVENVHGHAGIVAEFARRRALLTALDESAAAVRAGGVSSHEVAQSTIQQLLPFSVDDASRAGYVQARDAIVGTLEEIEARINGARGMCTGYPGIDEETGGFRDGELLVVGGAEKMGKSAVTLNIALNVVSRPASDGGGAVGYVSAEMTREMLLERCLAWHSSVDVKDISTGRLTPDQFRRLVDAGQWIATQPLWIDDEAEPSLADVVARATHLKASHPEIRLIVVDFLQLVHAREKGITEAQELKRVAYGLKRLAKRLKVVVLAPCQVNTKEVEVMKDMRPQLKDLQGSSGMRQAADFIALLYRDGFYNAMADDPDLLEVRFAACRRTAPFIANLRWYGPTLRIDAPSKKYKMPAPRVLTLDIP